MTYDIPQKLQYKEEIMFRLTAQQLLYVILFLPIAVLIMTKVSADIVTRVTLAAIPATIAILFMFTNIPKKCRSITRWFFWRTIAGKKMKKYLSVKFEGSVMHVD